MSYQVEKDWITESGLRAVVIWHTDMGFRCGYVGLPKDHPLHGAPYNEPCELLSAPPDGTEVGKRGAISLLIASGDPSMMQSPEIVFDVHGGLTYSNSNPEYPVQSDLWWFGYDCGHAGDATGYHSFDGDVLRDLDYCTAECESLALQIESATKEIKNA